MIELVAYGDGVSSYSKRAKAIEKKFAQIFGAVPLNRIFPVNGIMAHLLNKTIRFVHHALPLTVGIVAVKRICKC